MFLTFFAYIFYFIYALCTKADTNGVPNTNQETNDDHILDIEEDGLDEDSAISIFDEGDVLSVNEEVQTSLIDTLLKASENMIPGMSNFLNNAI